MTDVGGPAPRSLSTRELIALLAPTVGQEKSREAVLGAARRLGLEGDTLALEEALSILDHLAANAGILAVASRFVRERFATRALGTERPPPSVRPLDPALPGAPAPRASGVVAARLKAQLAPALGQEKSEQLVADARKQLGFNGCELTPEQALAVLDLLSSVPGLVGVTARFVKARSPRGVGK